MKRVLAIAVFCTLCATIGTTVAWDVKTSAPSSSTSSGVNTWEEENNAPLAGYNSTLEIGTTTAREENIWPFAGYNVPFDQGITTDGVHNYGFSTAQIMKYSLGWTLIDSTHNALRDVGLDPRFGHIGAGKVFDGKIYAPCCEWRRDVTPNIVTHNRIGIWNASDLNFAGYVDLSHFEKPVFTHGIDASCITIRSDEGFKEAYIGTYFNSTGTIWHFDMRDWSLIDTITPGGSFKHVQGIDYYEGYLYAAVPNKGIVRILPDGANETTVIPVADIGHGELEGISLDAHGTISVLMNHFTELGRPKDQTVYLYSSIAGIPS
ncbi:MAG: hypothetical protein ACXV5T_01910 [Halobacteriota archaeon]